MTLTLIANMNERIKELEKQCWNHRVDGVLVDGHLHFDTQKFAELIIRECVATVKKRYMGDNNREDMEVRRCVADIQTHFGVKE